VRDSVCVTGRQAGVTVIVWRCVAVCAWRAGRCVTVCAWRHDGQAGVTVIVWRCVTMCAWRAGRCVTVCAWRHVGQAGVTVIVWRCVTVSAWRAGMQAGATVIVWRCVTVCAWRAARQVLQWLCGGAWQCVRDGQAGAWQCAWQADGQAELLTAAPPCHVTLKQRACQQTSSHKAQQTLKCRRLVLWIHVYCINNHTRCK
jgi:hypothetical protein